MHQMACVLAFLFAPASKHSGAHSCAPLCFLTETMSDSEIARPPQTSDLSTGFARAG
jgi:hypothetical protein